MKSDRIIAALLVLMPWQALPIAGARAANEDSGAYPATHEDKFDALKTQIEFLFAFRAIIRGNDESICIGNPLSLSERKKLHHMSIKSVEIKDGAEENLFDDPKLFPHLEEVCIGSDSFNRSYITALALNYPRLKYLTLYQDQPLEREVSSCLRSFRRLSALDLICPLSAPDLLVDSLPDSLVILQLTSCRKLPKLPSLEELRILGGAVDRKFLEELQAPNLRFLIFEKTEFSQDSFEHLSRLRKVRAVDISNSALEYADFKLLRSFPQMALNLYKTPILNKPEQLSPVHK